MNKSQRTEAFSEGLQGRTLFSKDANYDFLEQKIHARYTIKRTSITETFKFDAFKKQYNQDVLPMFIAIESKKLQIITPEKVIEPTNGQVLISLVPGDTDS